MKDFRIGFREKKQLIFCLFFAAVYFSVFCAPSEKNILQESDDVLSVFNLAPRAKEYASDLENLVSMEYEGENFVPYKRNDSLEIVHSYKNDVARYFYDDFLRIKKKEIWIIRNAENYEKIATTEYSYKGESFFPSECIEKTKNQILFTAYDDEGNVLLKKKSILAAEKEVLLTQENYSYDVQNRIIKSSVLEYFYSKDYSVLDYEFLKENHFSYNEFGRDSEYFENGVLKNSVKYKSKDGYETQVFFEGGNSVITYYEKSKKIREQYVQNKKVIREVVYE